MSSADTDAVRTLWATRFGGDPTTRTKWIDCVLDPDHSAAAQVAVGHAPTSVVGFSVLERGNRSYTRRYLGLDELGVDAPIAAQNGLFHMCCVNTAWEGRGVGTALHRCRLHILVEANIPRAFGIAWHRQNAVDSRVLFEKHDFVPLATVSEYYAQTTPRKRCPDCAGPCTCAATLYTREVNAALSESLHHGPPPRFDISRFVSID